MKTRASTTLIDRSEGGFSLIELMVAMTIGLFLIGTIGYAFIGAKKSFNSMDALATIQEGARFAFEYMGEDIRMAGFTGGPATGGSPINVVNDPTSGWDASLKNLFGLPLRGYELSGFPLGVSPLTGTDALTVVRADEDQAMDLCLDSDTEATCIAANPPTASTFTLRFASCPSSSDLPQAGQIVVASDYTHAAVFQIESASSCGSGSMTVGYDSTSGSAAPGNQVPSGSTPITALLGAFNGAIKARKLYPLKAATYYIANNGAGEPTLYRLELGHTGTSATASATEVLEGVKDMEIEYGVDTDATEDQIVNGYWDATQVTNGTDGTNSISGAATLEERWKRVLSVRITLTLVSRQGINVTTAGGLLEKTFTTTIAVRNRLL